MCLNCQISIAFSQNLVPNYSFEEYIDCPTNFTDKLGKQLIPYWQMPTKGTSDYFNSCSKYNVSVPSNFIGNKFAFDGHAYVGLILLELKEDKKNYNYREYIQAELHEPLVEGQKYLIELHYAIADYSTYSINRLGVCITEGQLKGRKTSRVIDCKPQLEIDAHAIETDRDGWFELKGTYVAEGSEKYITIGNFYSDSDTEYEILDLSELRNTLKQRVEENRLAYYYIDAVSVVLID